MRCGISLFSVCISLKNNVLSTFLEKLFFFSLPICILLYIDLSLWSFCSNLLLIFIRLFVILLLSCRSLLYLLNPSPLSDLCVANIFSRNETFLFLSLMSFDKQNFLMTCSILLRLLYLDLSKKTYLLWNYRSISSEKL